MAMNPGLAAYIAKKGGDSKPAGKKAPVGMQKAAQAKLAASGNSSSKSLPSSGKASPPWLP